MDLFPVVAIVKGQYSTSLNYCYFIASFLCPVGFTRVLQTSMRENEKPLIDDKIEWF